jgi:hypothetical protein
MILVGHTFSKLYATTLHMKLSSEENAKEKHKKNEIKANRILTDSIKDNLVPNVSELKIPKEMFDALTGLCESKNTSMKLTLRHQLRNVMMNKSETISNYFMRISQSKD